MTRRTKRLVVLGSTGSIGTQTLDVVERLNRSGWAYEVSGLSGGKNRELLALQSKRHCPSALSIGSEADARSLREAFPDLEILHGPEGPCELVRRTKAEIVVNALVGSVGLAPTLEALSRGYTVALANKESLVVGGQLVTDVLRTAEGCLLPIDSEHNAIFQCLQAGRLGDVRRLILTASGGPFLNSTRQALESVAPADALRHPTWSMGSRITIDSATLVNKAFEVIEAHYLFGFPYERIQIAIHPQSVIHSLVEFNDGSVVAELASQDMRIPIQYALTYPERPSTELPRLDFSAGLDLGIQPMDPSAYPAFHTVLSAARLGGSGPAAINAADEALVSRFLAGEIRFTDIARGLESVLASWQSDVADADGELTLDRLLSVDRWARTLAESLPFSRSEHGLYPNAPRKEIH